MEAYAAVRIHECGKEDRETVLLIHPLVVKRDYFEPVIPLLQEGRHLLIPALPGYDLRMTATLPVWNRSFPN